MIWLMFLVIPLILLIFLAVRPMKIPREPEREGQQEGDAVAAYDRTNGWSVFSIERWIILHQMIKDKPQGRLLDIGCGPGFLAAAIGRKFKNNSIIGLDINRQMLDIAEKRWPETSNPNLSFLPSDAQQLPFADKTIDYVVNSLSMHHWQNPEMVFHEISRVLKPGGSFLIFDLKRDGPHYVYYLLKIGQTLVAPKPIKETNGAVGSFWSSYTLAETENMLAKIPFQRWELDKRSPLLIVRGHVKK